MVRVALGLGGNLGPTEEILLRAIRDLSGSVDSLRVAPLYRSAPEGLVDQPEFLNTAITGDTALSPDELLSVCQQLELAAGRRRRERFGPRPLDIDLLLFGQETRNTPELTLPHPRLRQRRFVLQPLADIAADLEVPPAGETVGELLARLPVTGGVEKIGWSQSDVGRRTSDA